METLVRSLATEKSGYRFASTGLTLTSKWHAYGANLLASKPEDMLKLVHLVETFSLCLRIQLGVIKCKTNGFIQVLHAIKKRKYRDKALEARLAHICTA